MVMKLGIISNYLVREEDEKLLDLHFTYIERYTEVPYTIYATVNRLLPRFREKLEHRPEVKICDYPTTDLRGSEEQSYYLEYLVRRAIEDGASHIVSLHVDSFPIRSGWAQELAAKVSESSVFAVVAYGPYTACLFFQREFHLKYRPTFELSGAELSSERYKQFCKEFKHIPHIGFGYFFKAYVEGLPWYPLVETNRGNAGFIILTSIYEDSVFHLGTATFPDYNPLQHNALIGLKKRAWKHFWVPILRILLYSKIQQKALGAKRFIIPRHLMGFGWKHVGFPRFFAPIFWDARRQLLEDPESYLNYLRTGKRKNKYK
jgi:hypothetical protein